MRDRDLYAKLLGIETPWLVRDVEARLDAREVEVFIAFAEGAETTCPECGAVCSRYDARTRTWRHLDIMQYRTLLTADVPRVTREVFRAWGQASEGALGDARLEVHGDA